MYKPNSTPLFLRCAAGFMAGITSSGITDVETEDYAIYGQMADAFAQEVDTIWGRRAPTAFELLLFDAASEAVWAGRSPLTVDALEPGSYDQIARAVIARVRQGNAQVISEGIDPNNAGGSSSSSGAPPLQVVNTGAIPTGGSAQTYLIALGGEGMPAPATYTTKTGRVKVTVQFQADANEEAGYTVDLVRDGEIVPFGAEARMVSTNNASGDGLGPSLFGTFVGVDEVDPGSAHSWGVQIRGATNEGGGPEVSIVSPGRACIIVEDVAAT